MKLFQSWGRSFLLFAWLALTSAQGGTQAAHAAVTSIAVASNFKSALEKLKPDFERETGHTLQIAAGSSGKLFAQIQQGAPFDVLLAADQETVQKLEEKSFAVPGSRFTYAVGELALISSPHLKDSLQPLDRLKQGAYLRLAIANPKTAPYGRAALEVLAKWKLKEATESKRVLGENSAQAFQFVATGNAELGIVAYSHWLERKEGKVYRIPEEDHHPIRQDAVLLKRGQSNPAAVSFLQFLKSARVKKQLIEQGYR
jgi:molybdate transport system substrate-binding protein